MPFSDIDVIKSGGLSIQADQGLTDGIETSSSFGFQDVADTDTVKIGGKREEDSVSLSAGLAGATFPEITNNLNNFLNASTDSQRYEAQSNLVNMVNDPYLKADSALFKALASIQA
jgi:hypothetical protein